MRENKTLGIILPGSRPSALGALLDNRTIGAIPFGGRYRLIDFILSSLVHSGIWDVAVITRNRYESLMEHLGSGRDWDLARKGGGLMLLPPVLSEDGPPRHGDLQSLIDYRRYLSEQPARYVVLAHADLVGRVDLTPMIAHHAASGNDVTVAYQWAEQEDYTGGAEGRVAFAIDQQERIIDVTVGAPWKGRCCCSVGILVMEKDLLLSLVADLAAHNRTSLARDLLQAGVGKLKLGGFCVEVDCCRRIHSISSYYRASMGLLDPAVRRRIFDPKNPVLTRVRDEVPVKYGLYASVKNSLVADGCIIDGEVENSVLFRGVMVRRGAVIKNCVIMQQTVVEEHAQLTHVIADRRCVIRPSSILAGLEGYPVVISQETVV